MPAEYFRTFLDYHYWARDRLVEALRQAEQAALAEAPLAGVDSPLKILGHLAGFEALWIPILESKEPEFVNESPGSVDEAMKQWGPLERRFRDFVAALDDDGLKRQMERTTPSGDRFVAYVHQVLSQFVIHSAQHRAELAALASHHGHSPGNLDLWRYLIEHGNLPN